MHAHINLILILTPFSPFLCQSQLTSATFCAESILLEFSFVDTDTGIPPCLPDYPVHDNPYSSSFQDSNSVFSRLRFQGRSLKSRISNHFYKINTNTRISDNFYKINTNIKNFKVCSQDQYQDLLLTLFKIKTKNDFKNPDQILRIKSLAHLC